MCNNREVKGIEVKRSEIWEKIYSRCSCNYRANRSEIRSREKETKERRRNEGVARARYVHLHSRTARVLKPLYSLIKVQLSFDFIPRTIKTGRYSRNLCGALRVIPFANYKANRAAPELKGRPCRALINDNLIILSRLRGSFEIAYIRT